MLTHAYHAEVAAWLLKIVWSFNDHIYLGGLVFNTTYNPNIDLLKLSLYTGNAKVVDDLLVAASVEEARKLVLHLSDDIRDFAIKDGTEFTTASNW